MPIRIDDAGRLQNLGDDELQLIIGQTTDVDLNVQDIVRRKLGVYPPQDDIYVLEALDYSGDRTRVSVRDYTKPSP